MESERAMIPFSRSCFPLLRQVPRVSMPSRPSSTLQTFPNPNPGRDYRIHMEIPEFSCLCPLTGQPDYACLLFDYVQDRRCVELKSLKLYIWSFHDQGAFHEAVTNRVLDDLVRAMRPRYLRIEARFNVRGGIFTTIVADQRKRGWRPQPAIGLDSLSLAAPRNGRA